MNYLQDFQRAFYIAGSAPGADCLSPCTVYNTDQFYLQACDGSLGQAWEVTGTSGNYQLHPATDTGLCLDVYYGGTSDGTPVLAYTCTGNNNQQWSID